jgi:endonuclease/exonuclease/phosphatase family metal-dependent hydrolase
VIFAAGTAVVDPGAVLSVVGGNDPAAATAAPWQPDGEPSPGTEPTPERSAADRADPGDRDTSATKDRARKSARKTQAASVPSTVAALPNLMDYPNPAAVDADLAAFAEQAELAAAAQRTATRQAGGPVEFDLASFNVLGAVHTAPGSDADHYAPWRMRAEWTGQYIQQRGLDVVGLQEIETHQMSALMRATRGEFDAWPGLELPKRAVQTSLIWRKDMFEAVKRSTLTIDFMSWQHPVPVVQLRHLATGRTFWVMNVHNAPRAWEAQRDAATRDEIALINKLRREGEKVFFLGDMNERDETACRVFAETDLVSPAGGSNNGRCSLPQNRRIDWIFGPPDVRYSNYALDRSPLVAQSTDHFVPQARVTIS